MAFSRLALSLLLGLTVSVGWVHAQTLTRLAASNELDGTDHTGEIISFSDVGSGADGLPRPWVCYTEDTGSVLWLFPDGSAFQLESRLLAVQDEVFIRDIPNFGVALHRGPTHFSPDGEHCCVRTATNERRCVTFTPCPTLSPLSNGTISYDADTNMATYTCDPGYAVTTISSITCNDVTMMWSSTVRPTCELSTTTCSDLTAPTNGMIGYNAETMNTRPVNTVATFTCNTGYTVTGDMTRTCGAGGVWSGTNPTCTLVDCGPLTDPTNGMITLSTTTFESTATYSCNSGHNLNGDTTRTCEANGDWSGSDPTCDIVDCGPLTDPTNGMVDTPTTTFESTATYSCNPDYQMTGLMVRTCTASGWSTGDDPVCTAICLEQLTLVNGGISYNPTSFPRLEGAVATHSCNEGYTGGGTRTCLFNRMWSGSSLTCTLICPDLLVPTNGAPLVYSHPTIPRAESSTTTYSCVTGYDFSGTLSRTCTTTGWSALIGGTPTCTVVDCGSLSDPTNGRVMTTGGTIYQRFATYSCNPGYTRSGGQTRTCQASGEWSGSEPVCNPVDCGPLTINNGQVSTSPGTTFGSTATYTCNPGYIQNGPSTRTCQADTVWRGDAPTCDVLCPREPLSNGMVTYSPSDDPPPIGAVATYSCDTGYELSGSSTRNCVAVSGWNTSLPVCNPVDCRDLSNPLNGQVSTSSGTTFMMTATYTCNTGYNIVGSDTRTCGATALWTLDAPTCAPVDCGPLTVPNGQVSSSGTTFMNTATYTCDDGYNLNEATTRTCQANGNWSLTAPTCDPVDCGPLNNTANGQVSTSSGTTFMMTATYSCNTGYLRVGSVSRTCGASGTSGVWSGEAPVCNLIPLSSESGVITNNSALSLAAIRSSALTCRTELTTCCRGEDNNGSTALGGWRGPGGNIPESSMDGFYVSRSISSISLNLAEGSSEVAGTYCCQVPRESGTTTTHCVMVTVPPVSPPFPVAAIVGGAVGAIVVVILVILLIIFLVLFLRRSRKKQYEPSAKNSGFSTVYTKHSDTDGVATISKDQEPTITGFPSESRGNEGGEVVIKPKVGGHPPPSLTWYHDGRKVTADYATELDQDGGLSFPSVETKHAGNYKLAAVNDSGSIEKQVHLSVRGENEEPPPVNKNIDLGPLPVEQLGVFVSDLHANGNLKFKDAYKTLDNGEKGHDVVVAKIPENKLCNRFGNIAVYDDNRIVLQPIPGQEDCQGDYINACYVDGYQAPKKFIASQGPIPRTVVDFWRLMWQERPPIIVMLTNLKEGNKVKCQPYWPESGKKQFGPFTVAITDQQIFADYTMRTIKVTIEGDRKFLKTTQFHFTTWPDHGVPEYATPILAFHRKVKSQHKPSRGPLLVHCSAGVGRTGTYIAIDNILDQIAAEGMVDISGTIVRVRNQRMKMVQTQDQYVFIHDAILESVTCGDTQISAGDLRRQIQKMSSVAPGKTISDFQYQFQILEQVSPNPKEINSSTALGSMDKNRGKKYLPADVNRVVLKGEQPDYIHAVFAHGYKHQKAYIIAQNPLDSTVRNFWKVIYSRKCAAVVMLTPLSENGQEACSQYWPESGNVTSFGEFTIDNLGEETNTGFVMRQLSVLNEKTQKAHQLTQFHITNWKSSGKCENLKTVTDINEEVIKVQRRTGNKAIVVHCSDTATRSGMYCSIANTIDRCKTEGVVDVFQVVKALRVHKPGAVPSVDNYKNLFDAILVYLDSFDTYANF